MRQRLLHIFGTFAVCLLLAACSSGPERSLEMCVKPSDGCSLAPKKATSRPYKINGIWYYPQPHFEYEEIGIASYYGGGDVFHGRPTATGEIFDMNEVTGAHKTLPLPCVAEVTNMENGRQIQIKVNDRGPFVKGRIIDVSRRTAQLLGFEGKGTAKVRVRTLVPESLALNGLDPMIAPSSPVMLAEQAVSLPEISSQKEAAVAMDSAPLPRLPDTLFEELEAPSVLAAASPPAPSSQAASAPSTSSLAASAPVVKPEVMASRGIFVQVGGYASPKEAKALSKSLAGMTNSPSQSVKNSGPKPYAVRLGPLPSMSRANQMLDQLVDAGHVMSRIVIHH